MRRALVILLAALLAVRAEEPNPGAPPLDCPNGIPVFDPTSRKSLPRPWSRGTLGPLGTELKIEGERDETAPELEYVRVESVNGRRLDAPIPVYVKGLPASVPFGTRLVLRGYETAAWVGYPMSFLATHLAIDQPPFHYQPYFVVAEVVAPPGVEVSRLDRQTGLLMTASKPLKPRAAKGIYSPAVTPPGPLGRPLGEMVRIEAAFGDPWVGNVRRNEFLRVEKVDGVALPKPVEIDCRGLDARVGDRFVCVGFQTGEWINTPFIEGVANSPGMFCYRFSFAALEIISQKKVEFHMSESPPSPVPSWVMPPLRTEPFTLPENRKAPGPSF